MLPWPVESMVFQALLIGRVVLYPAPRFRRFARSKTAERRVPPDVEAAHTCTAGCRQVDARPNEPDESTRHFIFQTMGLPYTIFMRSLRPCRRDEFFGAFALHLHKITSMGVV